MLAREPSRTALGAASHRPAHYLDGAPLFADPRAISLLWAFERAVYTMVDR